MITRSLYLVLMAGIMKTAIWAAGTGVVLAILSFTSAKADIFEWEYIDPSNPLLGKQASTTLCPDGAGIVPAPAAVIHSRDLTKAYLSGADLAGARVTVTDLSFADLSDANLASAMLSGVTLTGASLSGAIIKKANLAETTGFTFSQLYSTGSYKLADLAGIQLYEQSMDGWGFAGIDLSGSNLRQAQLSGANFSNANLSVVNLTGATLTRANMSGAKLVGVSAENTSIEAANLQGADLTNVHLTSAKLTNTSFKDAVVKGASFHSVTGFTAGQLYSTSSYKQHDLTGVHFSYLNLGNWDFSGQDLTDAQFLHSTMTGAKLTNARVNGVRFQDAINLTPNQLYSTASYQEGDLSDMSFYGLDLAGWDFSNKKLANVLFYYDGIENVDFTGSDARDAHGYCGRPGCSALDPPESATTKNMIFTDGHIEGLNVADFETMRLWDYNDETPIPIQVQDSMVIAPSGYLRAVFEDDEWGSTLHFDAGIDVSIDGILELLVDDDADVASLVGTSFQLFDWTVVAPVGVFDEMVFEPGTTWDTSQLYTTGMVTLTSAVPEPSTLVLVLLAGGLLVAYRRG